MISWKELRERRITQTVVTYLAAGWVALAGVDQLVDREVLSGLFYRLGLLLYLAGIPAALIIGWYHGEKGRQHVTLMEMLLLGGLLVGTAGAGFVVVDGYEGEGTAVAVSGLGSEYDPRRVAVLYFEDEGRGEGEENLAFLADGLTESLIRELSLVPTLDVVSQNGVEPYRGSSLPPDSIGRALDAGSVIRGTVQPDGERVRVNVYLTDSESGADIERRAFTLPSENLQAVRDSLVDQAAGFLRARLGEEVRIRRARAETESAEAWRYVLRAERLRTEAETARQEEVGRALELYEQADSLLRVAESLDTDWARPTVVRAGIALDRALLYHTAEEALQQVEEGIDLADAALERNPRSAGAREARGTLLYYRWILDLDTTPEERSALLDRAQSDLETAVDLDPTRASALNTLSSLFYERKDRVSAALRAREALQADAYLSDVDQTYGRLFWSHYDLGQFAQAERTCREAAARFREDPDLQRCQLWMMVTPTANPDPERAWQLLARIDSLTPPDQRPFQHRMTQMIVGGVLARANLPDSARSVLVDARGGPDVDPNQELYGFEAIFRTMLGDHDEAVRRLRQYVAGNPDHSFLQVEGDLHWWWRPLRDHPDFASVEAPS